jgi:NAD(P)-dependent dehydrogenase (short-subunit alcohol dehydrogenase family)
MAGKLAGKGAVVTGAGGERGMGRAIAIALAAEGAKVVVNDVGRDKDGTRAADRVVRDIGRASGTAVANYDSVASVTSGKNIIKTAIDAFGRIDILVNCAGNTTNIPFDEMTEEQWDSIINVHIKGHFACTQEAVRYMMEQKNGRVINFSSRGAFPTGSPRPAGASNRPSNPAYGTAEAGIMGFTTSLSNSLKPFNITVNCIIPSADTGLFPGTGPRGGGVLPDTLDLGAEFVAPMVAYLVTDDARDITGKFIYVAGGDFCIYAQPLEPRTFVRKEGKWTIDELSKAVPPILRLA